MRWLLSVVLCFFVLSLQAETSVWKVSKDEKFLFIGGTIHVLASTDYPLPDAFSNAYKLSKKVYFETDIDGVSSPEFQARLLSALTYKNGETLKKVLKQETYDRLVTHCQSIGLPVKALQKLKPGIVSITLTMVELKRLGLADAGVDSYFHQLAVRDNKEIGQFETIDQQLGFIVGMGDGQESELIESTLDEIKDIPELMKKMKMAWKTGDSQRLDELAVKNVRQDFPKLYKSLFLDRNNAWLPKIESMLNSDEVEMVLVGAGHLVGNEGIIRQLARKGYKIQQL